MGNVEVDSVLSLFAAFSTLAWCCLYLVVDTYAGMMKRFSLATNAFPENKPFRKTKEHTVKIGLAQMLKGGVIMDVADVEQARIAEGAEGGSL